jgi:uncharacterized protein (TIGR02646 family)
LIHVARLLPPAYLAIADVARWHSNLCNHRAQYYRDLAQYHRKLRPDKPTRPRADKTHYGHQDVRMELRAMFGSKCGYCEAEVAAISPQHVEHYRPASRYPGLAYQWDNLLLACPHCNSTYKSDRFPVAPAGNTPDEHRRNPCLRNGVGEVPLLLNPCIDDPNQHLTFREGRVVALTNRGRVTRRGCGLNRDDLIRDRRLWLRIVRRSIEEYMIAGLEGDQARRARHANDLKLFVTVDAPYSAMARAELDQSGIPWRSW